MDKVKFYLRLSTFWALFIVFTLTLYLPLTLLIVIDLISAGIELAVGKLRDGLDRTGERLFNNDTYMKPAEWIGSISPHH